MRPPRRAAVATVLIVLVGLAVLPPPAEASHRFSPDPEVLVVFGVLGSALVGIGLLKLVSHVFGPPSWQLSLVTIFAGLFVLAAGAYIVMPKVSAPAAARDQANPVPADAQSLARGETVHAAECAPCHGSTGDGKGPLAGALRPAPTSFRQQAASDATPGEDAYWIAFGIPGTAMPAYHEKLSERDIWDVVNYLRTFRQQ